MATKKSQPKQETVVEEKSTMIKIAETIGEVAGEISVKSEQITDIASNALDAVKSKLHDITAPKVDAIKNVVKETSKKAEPKIRSRNSVRSGKLSNVGPNGLYRKFDPHPLPCVRIR